MRTVGSEAFWHGFARQAGIAHEQFDVASLNLSAKETAETLELVEAGVKRSIAAPLEFFSRADAPMPRRGGFVVVLDARRRPRLIWRSREVEIAPLGAAGEAFASRAAVGDGTPATFVREATKTFRRHAPHWGIRLGGAMETVFETFEVVWPPMAARRAGIVAGHLERAMEMRRLAQAAAHRSVVDLLEEPALVVDGGLRVLTMNAAAEAALRQGDGLRLAGGRLMARTTGAGAALGAAVASAMAVGGAQVGGEARRRGRVLTVERTEPHSAWTLRILPLAASDGLALVQLDAGAPPAWDAFTAAAAAQLFGLTPAELRLAGRLADGLSLGGSARALGVSVNTVRAQLRSIFAKTDVGSQAELLRRLDAMGTARLRTE